MGRKRLRLFGRRGPAGTTRAAARPPRPADPRAIRRRQEALEPELDNREQLRRRAAADAILAAAMAPPASPAPAPARPAPASPVLAIPVRRVLTRTALAVCVEAWGLEVWLPLGVIHDPEDPILSSYRGGTLLVSSSWAARAGLPPTTRSSP